MMMMTMMVKMEKSIKRMVLTGAAVTVMMSLASPAAMAQEEVQVPDHPDGSSNGNSSSTLAEEPLKDPGIKLSGIIPTDVQKEEDTAEGDSGTHDPSSPVEAEGRLKDPGIRLGDITPTDGQGEDTADGDSGTHDPGSSVEEEEDRIKDPGIRLCDITPTDCQNPDDSQNDKKNEHNDKEKYLEYCNSPSFVYDPACDKDYSKADPDAKDPNPGKEEDSAQKTPVVRDPRDGGSSNSDEVGQLADSGQIANSESKDSPTVQGCPFDFEYYEPLDLCKPGPEDFPLLGTFAGVLPWPDSFGGLVSLFGQAPGEAATAVGFGIQAMIGHYVGDSLVEFGEGLGPIGWPIQGVGHAVGIAADTAGVILEGAGQVVGAVTDGAGAVVDTVVDNVVTPVLGGVIQGVESVVEGVEKVADVAKSTWKKITSWF
jgi:hypothetical protein